MACRERFKPWVALGIEYQVSDICDFIPLNYQVLIVVLKYRVSDTQKSTQYQIKLLNATLLRKLSHVQYPKSRFLAAMS